MNHVSFTLVAGMAVVFSQPAAAGTHRAKPPPPPSCRTIFVETTRSLGRFGPLTYGVGVHGTLGAADIRRFAEAGGELVRLLPPEGGWSRLSTPSLEDCLRTLAGAGLIPLLSVRFSVVSPVADPLMVPELTGAQVPPGLLIEAPRGLSAIVHWNDDGRHPLAERVRPRLTGGPVPALVWPRFAVLPLAGHPVPTAEALRRRFALPDDNPRNGAPVLLCYPVEPTDEVPDLFETFCRLTGANPVGLAPTLPEGEAATTAFQRVAALTRLLSQFGRLRAVRVFVSTSPGLQLVAGRFAGGSAVAAAHRGEDPFVVTWSLRTTRGVFQPQLQLLNETGQLVADEELPPVIAPRDGSVSRVTTLVPGRRLCALRLTNYPYLAYRAMGDIRTQVARLGGDSPITGAEKKLLLLPLSDARKSVSNLLARVPLTPRKVEFWSHQSLLRLAQVELAFRNLVALQRLDPLAAGALAGQIQQALEYLSCASSSGFGLLLHKDLKPPTTPRGPYRVSVRVRNTGPSAVSRVTLEIASDDPIRVTPVTKGTPRRLPGGGSLQATFLVHPAADVCHADCRAVLSYSALRSFARRSVSFRLTWDPARPGRASAAE